MKKTKQPALEVAAAIADVAKKVGRAYVFASASKDILRHENASAEIAKQKFTEFACGDCGTSFDALSEVANPFCLACGSEKVTKGQEKATQHIHPDSELISVTCATCSSINVAHAEFVKAAKDSMHCSACGTELARLTVKADDGMLDTDDVSVDDMEVLDTDDIGGNEGDTGEMMLSESDEDELEEGEGDTDSLEEGGDEDDSLEEGEGEDDVDDLLEEGESEDENETAAEGDDAEDLHDELPEGGEPSGGEAENLNDEMPKGAPSGTGTAENLNDALPTQPVKEGGSVKKVAKASKAKAKSKAALEEILDTDDAGESADVEDIEMTDMVDDENLEEMSVIAMGKKVMLASGPYIFASLKEEDAGANKDIFQTAQFQRAIIASLHLDGAKKTMEAFHFTPVKVKAKLGKHVAKLVQAKMKQEGADLSQLRESLTADFKQSLDIAAVGLNKSFWKGVQNPLKAALTNEMAVLGIRNPERLINRVFEQHGLTYASTLIKQSTELLLKSKAMRNELASVLDMTSVVQAEGEEDGDDSLDTLEASLKPLSDKDADALRKELNKVSANAPKSRVQQILGSTDEPLFSI